MRSHVKIGLCFMFVVVLSLHSCRNSTPTVLQITPTSISEVDSVSTSSVADLQTIDGYWEKLQMPLSCSSTFILSDDGQWAACEQTNSTGISIMPIEQDFSDESVILADDQTNASHRLLSFVPKTHDFVFQSWDLTQAPESNLWLLSASDVTQKRLLFQGSEPVLALHWSPNGSHCVLVYESGWAELVMSIGNRDQKTVSLTQQLRPISTVAWSPSSDRIFYHGTTNTTNGWVSGGWIMELDSMNSTLLVTTTWAFEPSWAPNGGDLVLLGQKDVATNEWQLTIISTDGELIDIVSLPNIQQASNISWSPNGELIAFDVLEVGSGIAKIGIVDLVQKKVDVNSIPDFNKSVGWIEGGSEVLVWTKGNVLRRISIGN